MKIWLAPMEGLMDSYLRQLITETGSIDLVVSEFVRVVDLPIPKKTFLQAIPELNKEGFTKSRVPLRVQLLGSNPHALAESANTAIELGSNGIDFNFGCPSNTVNRRNGGAALLKQPEIIFDVIQYARRHLPKESQISAKMRLGVSDKNRSVEIAKAIESAGANEIIVHGRTKIDGYKPPADWESIGRIRESININVVANGDIFSASAANECLKITGCSDVMIGRGAVFTPNLANTIKNKDTPMGHEMLKRKIISYTHLMIQDDMNPKHIVGRVKQWVKIISTQSVDAKELFIELKYLNTIEDIIRRLN